MMRKVLCMLAMGLALCARALGAGGVADFPADRAVVTIGCRGSGERLAGLARDREEGMPEVTAASSFFETNRDVGRVGSHIPNHITRPVAGALAKFVYAYPNLPKAAVYDIGVYHCEILQRIPAGRPGAGDVLPLLAINAGDCLKRLGDPVPKKIAHVSFDFYENDAVDACLSHAAKAITEELLKGAG